MLLTMRSAAYPTNKEEKKKERGKKEKKYILIKLAIPIIIPLQHSRNIMAPNENTLHPTVNPIRPLAHDTRKPPHPTNAHNRRGAYIQVIIQR
jgi:hypothetical protein